MKLLCTGLQDQINFDWPRLILVATGQPQITSTNFLPKIIRSSKNCWVECQPSLVNRVLGPSLQAQGEQEEFNYTRRYCDISNLYHNTLCFNFLIWCHIIVLWHCRLIIFVSYKLFFKVTSWHAKVNYNLHAFVLVYVFCKPNPRHEGSLACCN